MAYSKADKGLGILLSEKILATCRSVLPFTSTVCVEGLLAITLDEKQFCVVHVNKVLSRSSAHDINADNFAQTGQIDLSESSKRKVAEITQEVESVDSDSDLSCGSILTKKQRQNSHIHVDTSDSAKICKDSDKNSPNNKTNQKKYISNCEGRGTESQISNASAVSLKDGLSASPSLTPSKKPASLASVIDNASIGLVSGQLNLATESPQNVVSIKQEPSDIAYNSASSDYTLPQISNVMSFTALRSAPTDLLHLKQLTMQISPERSLLHQQSADSELGQRASSSSSSQHQVGGMRELDIDWSNISVMPVGMEQETNPANYIKTPYKRSRKSDPGQHSWLQASPISPPGMSSVKSEISASPYTKPDEAYIDHIQHENGATLFKCTICFKDYTSLINIKRHLKTHKGNRPFVCDFCHKSFHRRDNLNEHRRIHTGEKPYRCNLCGAIFRQNTMLNTHMAKDHNITSISEKRNLSSLYSTQLSRSDYLSLLPSQREDLHSQGEVILLDDDE